MHHATHASAFARGALRALVALAALASPACAVTDDTTTTEPTAQGTAALVNRDPGDPADPPEILRCDDHNPCTFDQYLGGRCIHTREADGTDCGDGNACNGAEVCRLGICRPGAAASCDDGNACTDDRCVPSRGCVHTNNAAPCSDGFACTVVDRCEAGVCRGSGTTSGTPTVPVIESVATSAPAPGALLTHDTIDYLQGNTLDVAFTLPNCAWVTGVRAGGRDLDTVPHTGCDDVGGPYDCEPRYYTILRDEPVFPELDPTARYASFVRPPIGGLFNRHRLTVRVHLQNTGDGASLPLVFTVRSAVGAVTHERTVAYVQHANATNAQGLVTISETELRNSLLAGMYAQFGDTGSHSEDGGRVYAPDYGYSTMTAASDGISFRMRFRAEVPNWCDPTVTARGRFRLVPAGTAINTEWLDGPHVDLDFAGYCDATTWVLGGPIYAIIVAMYQSSAEGRVRRDIEARVADMVASCSGVCAATISSITTQPGRVDVNLAVPFEGVRFDVRYDSVGLYAPAAFGLPLRAGDRVAVLPGGVVNVCQSGSTSYPSCGITRALGPASVFNWNAPFGAPGASPVDDPWSNPDGPAAYFAERAEVRAELFGLYRRVADLPRGDQNPGMLLARLGSDASTRAMRLAGQTCQLTAGARTNLAFGPNEPRVASGPGGSGRFNVGVVFAPSGISLGAMPGCN